MLASLAEVRAEIDSIDGQLLDLLKRRLALAPQIAAAKPGQPLYQPQREAEVLIRRALGPIPGSAARAIWTEIMAAMLCAEGLAAIVAETPALLGPARLRFGRSLPVQVDANAASHAADPSLIVVLDAASPLPPGCARLTDVPDTEGGVAGYVARRIDGSS